MYDRTRTRGGLLPHQYTGAQWWSVNNGVSSQTPPANLSANSRTGKVETMSDRITKAFAKLQREGGVINNPMSQDSITVLAIGDTGWKFQNNVSGTLTNHGEWAADWSQHVYGLPPRQPWNEELESLLKGLAATQAHADVKSPAVYGGVFIGEIRETIRMFRKPLGGLQDFINDTNKWDPYRGRKPRGSRKNRERRGRTTQESLGEGVNAAAQCWLEARLGWRPFLMELDALRKELEEGRFSERYTARGQSSRTDDTSQSIDRNTSGIITSHVESHQTTYTVRAGILYEGSHSITQRMGFDWSAVPVTAWELIPFSFVVDWFVNLGDYIQALTPKVGVRYLAAWTTVHRRNLSRRVTTKAKLNVSGWFTQRDTNGVEEVLYETKLRSPSIPDPTLELELDIVHALRNNRGWDALSLAIQQLRQPKGRPKWVR